MSGFPCRVAPRTQSTPVRSHWFCRQFCTRETFVHRCWRKCWTATHSNIRVLLSQHFMLKVGRITTLFMLAHIHNYLWTIMILLLTCPHTGCLTSPGCPNHVAVPLIWPALSPCVSNDCSVDGSVGDQAPQTNQWFVMMFHFDLKTQRLKACCPKHFASSSCPQVHTNRLVCHASGDSVAVPRFVRCRREHESPIPWNHQQPPSDDEHEDGDEGFPHEDPLANPAFLQTLIARFSRFGLDVHSGDFEIPLRTWYLDHVNMRRWTAPRILQLVGPPPWMGTTIQFIVGRSNWPGWLVRFNHCQSRPPPVLGGTALSWWISSSPSPFIWIGLQVWWLSCRRKLVLLMRLLLLTLSQISSVGSTSF